MNRKSLLLLIATILLTILIFVFVSGKRSDFSGHDPAVNQEAVPDSTPVDEAVASFSRFLRKELDHSHTVGAAVTIVHRDSVIFTGVYGVKKAGTRDSIDRHTVFRLASVSKGFAGVLACILDREGAIDLDEKVIHCIEGFRLKDTLDTDELDIRHILSHTSGLVPHAYDNLVEDGLGIADILPRMEEILVAASPGELYGYQNVVFSLIDTIVSAKTGKTYAQLLHERIFMPLGMQDASAGFEGFSRSGNLAAPHARTSRGYVALRMDPAYYEILPAAGVNASISDMGTWLVALLGHDPEIIDAGTLSEITTPVVYTPLKARYTRQWDLFRDRYYSLGWRIYLYRDRKIMYHGGYVGGYRAEIAFCPEEQVGIAFLQNSPNGMASKCVPGFFNILFDELSEADPNPVITGSNQDSLSLVNR